MREERRWADAHVGHESVLRAFTSACQRTAPDDWQRLPKPGKWSTARVALHICRAYELGRDAIDGGEGTRLLVSPAVAWVSRAVVLPVFLATERFPRGARAPAEVVPDAEEARLLTPDAAVDRLLVVADQAAAALRRAAAERPALRVTHAYFGPLTLLATLRLLSAHTRHHARSLPPPATPPLVAT